MVDVLTIVIGISFALIAAFSFNIAVILQKKGLTEAPEIKFEEGMGSIIKSFKILFQNKAWLSGFILGVLGWFPYIIAVGMVSVLVVSPLVSVGLVVFVIAAKKLLDERVSMFELVAIFILIVAPMLIALAEISNVSIDLVSFVIPFLSFLVVFISISLTCFMISKKKRGTPLEGLFLTLTGAILYSLGTVFTNIFTQALYNAGVNPIFFWEILFGIIWFESHLWVFIGFWGMLFFNVSSIIFYQVGFQKGKAILMFPIFNTITLIIPIIVGLFVFNQTFINYYFFTIALILILVATLILSKFQADVESMKGANTS